MFGYSTHGKWTSSKEIYAIEKDRGNVVDDVLLQDNYKAIWVCIDPFDAVRYLRTADDMDKPVTLKELQELVEVHCEEGFLHVLSMDDGDGGQLWISKDN